MYLALRLRSKVKVKGLVKSGHPMPKIKVVVMSIDNAMQTNPRR